jgi:hypothetical protein
MAKRTDKIEPRDDDVVVDGTGASITIHEGHGRALDPSGVRRMVTQIDPETGELLEPVSATELLGGDAAVIANRMPDDELAAFIDAARGFKSELGIAQGAVSREVIRRMDDAAHWTIDLADFKVSSDSPDRYVYDEAAVYRLLAKAVRSGTISPDAMKAAVKREYVYKVQRRGLNALLKRGDELAEKLTELRTRLTDDDKPRQIKLTDKRKDNRRRTK